MFQLSGFYGRWLQSLNPVLAIHYPNHDSSRFLLLQIKPPQNL